MDNKYLGYYTQAVQDLIEVTMEATKGIYFETAQVTTNNFEKFKEQTEEAGFMTVSSEGCEETIYGSALINIRARLWHDIMHLEHDLSFSAEDEIQVAKLQGEQVQKLVYAKYGHTRAVMARLLVEMDIIEQVKYYQECKMFVPYQEAYIKRAFIDSLESSGKFKEYSDILTKLPFNTYMLVS